MQTQRAEQGCRTADACSAWQQGGELRSSWVDISVPGGLGLKNRITNSPHPKLAPTPSLTHLHGVAVDQLLLAQRRQVPGVDGVYALHAAGRRERPARAALRIVVSLRLGLGLGLGCGFGVGLRPDAPPCTGGGSRVTCCLSS